MSLAVAERSLNFEHRDLHWGNVLVSQTKLKSLKYVIDGRTVNVATNGVKVAVIDFTLSRLTKGMFLVYLFPNGCHDSSLLLNVYIRHFNENLKYFYQYLSLSC